MPYFEKGLFVTIEAKPAEWAWRIDDLIMPWTGCGRTAVGRGVERLKEWGYLRVEPQGLGPSKGVIHRCQTYPNGDAPPLDNRAARKRSRSARRGTTQSTSAT